MYPVSNRSLSPWMVDEAPCEPSDPDGPSAAKRARRDAAPCPGAAACERLRPALGDRVDGLVQCPEKLESRGRPIVLDFLADRVVVRRGGPAPEPVLVERVARLSEAMLADNDLAVRCALIATEQASAEDRLTAMETMADELRRVPMGPPRSRGQISNEDKAHLFIHGFGMQSIKFGSLAGFIPTPTVFPPARLDRPTIAELRRLLGPLSKDPLTPSMRFLHQTAMDLLSREVEADGRLSLTREDESLLIDVLHLKRLFGMRLVSAWSPQDPPLGPFGCERVRSEAMPSDAREALATLCTWAGEADGVNGLRRERWYAYLARQVHWPDRQFALAGVLRGLVDQDDLDAPPTSAIAALAASRGSPVPLLLAYRGEPVADAGEVNRQLADRFAFGLQLSATALERGRLPPALHWKDATALEIDKRFDDPSMARMQRAALEDLPNLVWISFGCVTAPPDFTDFWNQWDAVSPERGLRQIQARGIVHRIPGAVWNGRQENRLLAHPVFLHWMSNVMALERATAGDGRTVRRQAILEFRVLARLVEDDGFAARCRKTIEGQDGACLDAYLGVLHQMALLADVGESGDITATVQTAFRFACMQRADNAAARGAASRLTDTIEDAMLLRRAVSERLAYRLGDVRAPAPDDLAYGDFSSAGVQWNGEGARTRRQQQADALIDDEIASAFAVTLDCLSPHGLVGDLLADRVERAAGLVDLKTRLTVEAESCHEAVDRAAGADDAAPYAALDAAAERADRDLAELHATMSARRQDALQPALLALTARLSERRPVDASKVAA